MKKKLYFKMVLVVSCFFSFAISANGYFIKNIINYSSSDLISRDNGVRSLYYTDNHNKSLLITDENGIYSLHNKSKMNSEMHQNTLLGIKYSNEREILKTELVRELARIENKFKTNKLIKDNKNTSLNSTLVDKHEEKELKEKKKLIAALLSKIDSLKTITMWDLYTGEPQKESLVIHDNKLYLVYLTSKQKWYKHPLLQHNNKILELTYTIMSSLTLGALHVDNLPSKALMRLEVASNSTVLEFETLSDKYTLARIDNEFVLQFEKMLNDLPSEVTEFHLGNEPLTTTYSWQKSNKEKKLLTVEYKKTGKKKNLTQVKTTAKSSLYDPQSTSDSIEKHIGVLAITKSNKLIELKKIQKINGNIDTEWAFDYKNGLVKLGDEIHFVENEMFYGFEGLWYLASQMIIDSIDSQKIYLINGTEPIALTVKRDGEQVNVSKGGRLLYRFSFNKSGFVSKFEFVPLKQELNLIGKDTPTTIKNRKTLNNFMHKNKIIKL